MRGGGCSRSVVINVGGGVRCTSNVVGTSGAGGGRLETKSIIVGVGVVCDDELHDELHVHELGYGDTKHSDSTSNQLLSVELASESMAVMQSVRRNKFKSKSKANRCNDG